MPYAHRKLHIPPELDRRRKLPESEHERVRQLYFTDKLSQREVAEIMGVSRRLIVFILYPERLEHHKKLYKERRKDGRYYPSKEKWREQMKKHRHYKESIKQKLI